LRRDGLALLVSQIVVALYWWHPLVWIAARAAATDRERACDDTVLRAGMRPSEYGQCLLAHADRLSAWNSGSLATVMFGHSAGLGARISALLDPTVDRSSSRPKVRMIAGVLGLVIIAGAASPYSRATVLDGISTLTPALVEASIIPSTAEVSSPANPSVGSRAISADLNVCQQAKDYRRAKTYVGPSVHITGSGATFRDGVTKLIWTGMDCIGWIQYSGSIGAATGEEDIVVGSNGEFLAHNEGPEGTSEYRVSNRSSSLTLNGQNIPIGPNERRFIAGMVHEYMRRSGTRPRERARAALQSGIPALLAEAAGVPQTDIRAQYLIEGFAATHDAQSVVRYIHQGAALLDSLDSRAPFLVAVPAAYKNNLAVLTAIYEEASVIEPDGAVDEVLDSTSPPRPLPASLQPLMRKIIAGISNSDRHAAMRAYYLGIRP
ncbi:MAG: M56 family metallopeptidase, partial [Gemmatimonadales bacterium]